MGHKVNPKIFRIGISKTWNSKWFSDTNYIAHLKQDISIRKYVEKKLKEASLDNVIIDRSVGKIEINIYSARPGMIIGKGGAGIESMKKYILQKILKTKKTKVDINIKEVNKPNLSARIIAQNIAIDLEKRMPYRRVMKKYIDQVIKAGGQGVKIVCGGRLGGVEIARSESLSEGKIPLHTIRADIDYSRLVANTTYGVIGVKVWIYKGEYFAKKKNDNSNNNKKHN